MLNIPLSSVGLYGTLPVWIFSAEISQDPLTSVSRLWEVTSWPQGLFWCCNLGCGNESWGHTCSEKNVGSLPEADPFSLAKYLLEIQLCV